MEELIKEMTLQEMQETFGGGWIIIIVDGKPQDVWYPESPALSR